MISLLVGLGMLGLVVVAALLYLALSSRERSVYRLRMPREQERAEDYLAWRLAEDARNRAWQDRPRGRGN